MSWVILLSVIWIVYGIAGLLGFQRMPPDFYGRSWVKEYKRASGIGWLMLGVPWLIAGLVFERVALNGTLRIVILAVLALPSIVYTVRLTGKYRERADQERKEENNGFPRDY